MNKDAINLYIANFRKFFAPYMKNDVTMKVMSYPYDDGALMVMELAIGKSNSTEFKSNSITLRDAMVKSGIFEDPENATSVDSTKILVSKSRFVVIKPFIPNLWDAKAAMKDVDNLMDFITDKKNGRR